MATARDQMKAIEAELERVRSEIQKLKIEEGALIRILSQISGKPVVSQRRRRASNVKSIVLDIVRATEQEGISSLEASELVKEKVPDVAKDTVSSVLSRLKGDGVLIFRNGKYFDKSLVDSKPLRRIQLPPLKAVS